MAKKKGPASKGIPPAKFTIEVNNVDLSEAEIEAIQNDIVKVAAARVKQAKGGGFLEFGRFDRFREFGSAGG